MPQTVSPKQDARLFVTGDVHGRLEDLDARMSRARLKEGDHLIVAGDVGLCYREPSRNWATGKVELETWLVDYAEQMCAERGVTLHVMRGNHDRRYIRDIHARLLAPEDMWVAHDSGETVSYVAEDTWPHIVFESDSGGISTICGKHLLLIPGAYSVDKSYRLYNGLPWEAEEELDDGELARIEKVARTHPVDAVISHTCPLTFFDEMSDLLMHGLGHISNRQEKAMDGILEAVRETSGDVMWYYGHFHADRSIGEHARLLYHDVVRIK